MTVRSLSGAVAIRPYEVSDAHDVYAAISESIEEMSTWMPWCHTGYSVNDAINWLVEQETCRERGTGFEFAIVGPEREYLGGCGINQVNREYRLANLGYWVRSGAVDRGIATQAVKQVARWAFANTDLIRLELVIATGNRRSIRVAEKAGAKGEGTLRSRLLLKGVPHDAFMYSLVRDDFTRHPAGFA